MSVRVEQPRLSYFAAATIAFLMICCPARLPFAAARLVRVLPCLGVTSCC
jgi:hypothetical protein